MDQETARHTIRRDIMRVARAGALAGSVAGWAGLLAAHGDAALAGTTAAHWTWLLVAAIPIGLVMATRSMRASARVLLTIGLLGGVIGVVLEFVVASYIPTVFSLMRLDIVTVHGALVAGYPWAAALTALAVTAVVALIEAMVFPSPSL